MKTFLSRISFLGAVLSALCGGISARAQLVDYFPTNAFPGLTFSSPVCIASAPGETNRLFIVEQPGVIVVITNLANPTRTVFLELTNRVEFGGEEGMLGLAFHPGFATNRYFYVFYTGPATNGTTGQHDILSRFTAWDIPWDPNMADPNSEVRLFVQYDEAGNHNGGDIHFGADGYLYISVGDEGGGGDNFNNSQRIDKDLFSGMLRIDVDKRPGNLAPNPHHAIGPTNNYLVPADNPYVGATTFNGAAVTPANVRTEFWAVGLRNPWRWSFDPVTGHLYCGDVGQGAREEIDIITKGGNYGWAYREGDIAGPKTAPGGFTSINPILDYDRSQGNCVIGGVVYRGSRFADLHGYYVYCDIGSGNVWALKYDGTNASSPDFLFAEGGISAFGIDPSNGDVLCANLNSSSIRRIVTALPPGSLQVTIEPPGAVTSGAQWRVNGGAFQNSGATVAVPAGSRTINFKTLSGWAAPANLTVTVNSEETTVTNATYIFTDTAKPTVVITAPKSNQRVSNEVFTVRGTAKDNTFVDSVWCSLNSNAWVQAAGTTNWSADLSLTPGNNNLRAYARDIGGNLSKTGSVNFFRVVSVPITVQTNGLGSVKPNYNGQLLEIGKSYTMSARAGRDFGFVNWTGSASNSNSRLTFLMASNLSFTANFVDIKDPLAIITFPPVNKTVSNKFVTVIGKASDNIGVATVGYQLNGLGWLTAETTNSFTNWNSVFLIPNAGGNIVQAWAADAAGNYSKTNSVKFNFNVQPSTDWAPDYLSGLIAQVAPAGGDPLTLSFDNLLFSQTGVGTNDLAVGNYLYIKYSSNTAVLSFTNSAPPTQTNGGNGSVTLIFTDHYQGVFTNDSGDNGPISFVIATNFAAPSLSGKRIAATGTHDLHNIFLKTDGTFSLTPSLSGSAPASVGTYAYTRHSPIGAMLVLSFTNPEAGVKTYVQMLFTSGKGGTYFATTFDPSGNVTDGDPGTFTIR